MGVRVEHVTRPAEPYDYVTQIHLQDRAARDPKIDPYRHCESVIECHHELKTGVLVSDLLGDRDGPTRPWEQTDPSKRYAVPSWARLGARVPCSR